MFQARLGKARFVRILPRKSQSEEDEGERGAAVKVAQFWVKVIAQFVGVVARQQQVKVTIAFQFTQTPLFVFHAKKENHQICKSFCKTIQSA